jgi:hypothetical protein
MRLKSDEGLPVEDHLHQQEETDQLHDEQRRSCEKFSEDGQVATVLLLSQRRSEQEALSRDPLT